MRFVNASKRYITKSYFVYITIVTLSFAIVAIVVLPFFHPTLFAAYGNTLLKCNCIKPAIFLFEKHIKHIEKDFDEGINDPSREYMFVVLNMRIAMLYADCQQDYNKAIDIILKTKVSFPQQCELWNCGFELSYYQFKKGSIDNAYETLKDTTMIANVESIDEMIVKFQSYDKLRSERPNKCR
ncbi:MAG TPA: hypothetical protein PKH33_01830 [bacterium]|nr:hypothetical protein [bacterium]